MSDNIHKSTRRIFSDSPRFVVPRYQREYSWLPQQIDQLLSDIDAIQVEHKSKTNITPKSTHFIGLLVFIDEQDEHGEHVYSVVDGQQRLSTILLIAAVTKDIISNMLKNPLITKEASEKITKIHAYFDQYIHISSRPFDEKTPKLEPNINDKLIYEILVLSEGTFEQKQNEVLGKFGKSGMSKKYVKAYAHIYDYISAKIEEFKEDYLINFFVKFDAGIAFIPFISESDTDAFNLFECLNDRGMSLSAMDLIKNKVLQKADPGELEQFEGKWSEVIGANGIIPADKAQPFIRNYLMLKAGHTTNSQVYNACKQFLLDHQSASNFLKEIYEYASYFRGISEVSASIETSLILYVKDDEIAEKLFLLNKTKVKQWQSLALAAYSEFQKSNLDKTQLLTILNLLLKLCVRFKLLNKRFNLIEVLIPTLAYSLHNGMVNGVSASKFEVVNFCIDELQKMIDKFSPANELFAALDSNYLYDDNDLAFILLRLLAFSGNAIYHGLTFSKTRKLTLEHVFPVKHEPNWGEVENADELRYSLGNMLLIELTENIKLSNKDFENKKAIYAKLNPLDLVTEPQLKYQNSDQKSWISTSIMDRKMNIVYGLKKLL